jgi:predicted CopG family antitoxin
MATADEQIRVSDRVKRELNRLRREGESYNDVLERVLDEDHVGELQTMISTISEWDVPQVLVVSHDEHLIENSDRTIQVEKDPSTETSKVVRPDEAKGGA